MRAICLSSYTAKMCLAMGFVDAVFSCISRSPHNILASSTYTGVRARAKDNILDPLQSTDFVHTRRRGFGYKTAYNWSAALSDRGEEST